MTDRADAVDAWESLYRAQVTVFRQLRAEFPTGEVTLTEYDVLFNLYRQPERRARIRDLTPQLLLSQPSVSRLIDAAARGLVDSVGRPERCPRHHGRAHRRRASTCSAGSGRSTAPGSPSA